MAHSVGAIFVYMFLNDRTYVARNAAWFYSQIEFFLPVFICWLMTIYFDGDFMRQVYTTVVTLSILGPFANHWRTLATMYLGGEG